MNINLESRFMSAPTVDKPRSVQDLSYEHQTTFNVGELIPIGVQEVYPGDTHKVKTSKVVRMQTLLNPIYGTFYLDVFHFFVPNRLIYDHWEELMGENKTSAWIPNVEYTTPMISTGAPEEEGSKFTQVTSVPLGSLADYMGIPVGYEGEFNALPLRAYAKVFEDWFKDENLQDPLNIYTGEATQYLTSDDADFLKETYMYPRKAGRMHDVFSSSLPAPQKGPEVTFPLISGDYAPVYGRDKMIPYDHTTTENPNAVRGHYISTEQLGKYGIIDYSVGTPARQYLTATDNGITVGNQLHFDNLWADLRASVGMTSINDLRMAFQVQRLLETDAYSGSRYVEVLKAHFGVTSPDARLQRSEYLGGNRIPLNVHQVVNSTESASYSLGSLGAISHTVDVHEDFVKSFVEHGWILTLAVVRYPAVYAQGLERFWSRSDRFSYYWPTLAHLGNMAVLNKEIYALPDAQTNGDDVFGYQEAWYDLRARQNRCSSEMRPGVSGSLSSWNLADYYTETPTLSADWIQFDPGVTDRVLAVGHNVSKQVFADFYIENYATRVLPMYSIPGLIDHF